MLPPAENVWLVEVKSIKASTVASQGVILSLVLENVILSYRVCLKTQMKTCSPLFSCFHSSFCKIYLLHCLQGALNKYEYFKKGKGKVKL